MSGLVRKNITLIKPYVGGKPIEETKRELGLRKVIKLASNENPLGPSPKAIKAIGKNIKSLNRYPDSNGFYLKQKIARSLKIHPAHIVLGNGSDELIDIIIKTFVAEDETILTSESTFLEYAIISKVNNRKVNTVALKNFTYDLVGLAKAIDKKTKLIFIANPNNPTGTYISKNALRGFLLQLPPQVIVVLDEAYDAFIDVQDYPRSLSLINQRNVIILKTFSKGYGLAGLRIGYALLSKTLASYMEIARQPFNTNLLAQAAAAAALSDKAFLAKTKRTIREGKSYLYKELAKMGADFIPSVTNFILINTKKDSVSVFKSLLREGVIVRDMAAYGLRTYIRVTIGKKEENKEFIRAFRKVLSAKKQ